MAFTLDVHGINPMTIRVSANELVQTLDDVERGLKDAARVRQDIVYYARIRSALRHAR